MEIRPDDYSPRAMYKLMIGCIVPRPIAWVTSLSDEGRINLAPFSFFNGVCSNPPTISLSFSWNPSQEDHRKDTYENIRRRGEFVVNMVDEKHAEAMNISAGDFPREVSEFDYLGLSAEAAHTGSTPRIRGVPASFECSYRQSVQIGDGEGSGTLVIAEVRHIHVEDRLLDDRMHIDTHTLKPVGRLAGNEYCYVHEIFALDRPKYSELAPRSR